MADKNAVIRQDREPRHIPRAPVAPISLEHQPRYDTPDSDRSVFRSWRIAALRVSSTSGSVWAYFNLILWLVAVLAAVAALIT